MANIDTIYDTVEKERTAIRKSLVASIAFRKISYTSIILTFSFYQSVAIEIRKICRYSGSVLQSFSYSHSKHV